MNQNTEKKYRKNVHKNAPLEIIPANCKYSALVDYFINVMPLVLREKIEICRTFFIIERPTCRRHMIFLQLNWLYLLFNYNYESKDVLNSHLNSHIK